MKKINAFNLLLLLVSFFPAAAQNIAGDWKGSLNTPNGNLELIIKISAASGGGISARMDVPAQRAKNIQASTATFTDGQLLLEFEMLRARYIGHYKPGSNSIAGSWEQGSAEFPLELLAAGGPRKRPQEPSRPYAYHEEEVTIPNEKAGLSLSATFTYPKEGSNFPAVVLISGSGPQNRDEEVLGHKPFLVLADELSKKGIAVLRFDDRGTGKSTGTFSTATTFDFSTDAEAVLAYLKTRKEVNKKRLGLLGHSEGGIIAPMVAARSKEVAFVVLLAAPGMRGSELLMLQAEKIAEASGVEEKRVAENRKINKQLYDLAAVGTPAAYDSAAVILKSLGMPAETVKVQLSLLSSDWFRYMVSIDPAVYLSKLTSPVLALNGKKDLQVPYRENLAGIEKGLKQAKNKHYSMRAYDGLNHLFQHANSGLPDEYDSIEETMSPEVLSEISSWILKQK